MTSPPEMMPLPPHACWHTPASNAAQPARTLHKPFTEAQEGVWQQQFCLESCLTSSAFLGSSV